MKSLLLLVCTSILAIQVFAYEKLLVRNSDNTKNEQILWHHFP